MKLHISAHILYGGCVLSSFTENVTVINLTYTMYKVSDRVLQFRSIRGCIFKMFLHLGITIVNLRGTKLGCGEGGCGACTVMISQYDAEQDTVHHYSVNACLAPVCSVDGMSVTTVEGIGSTQTVLHPCQERIAKAHGSQCGFCTPGFVMSMYSLLRNKPFPTEEEVEGAFEGVMIV